MPGLLHPPPPAVHGLLSVKRGGQFSKRVRRLAHLEKSVLELRTKENGPPDDSLSVLEHTVQGDDTALCITLTRGTTRLRLYAHTKLKYGMWLRALTASTRWHLSNFYQLVDDAPPLATGDFALVYRATDRETGQPVAIKHIHVRPDGPAEARSYLSRMVAREARIARIVSHPNIVRMRDVFEQRGSGSVHIVMDYLPHTLAQVLAAVGGRLCERDAATLMARILSSVAYLHGENIVHRDLKPDNVLCDGVGPVEITKVLLCDFGMATFAPKRPESPSVAARAAATANKPILIAKRLRNTDFGCGDENASPDGHTGGVASPSKSDENARGASGNGGEDAATAAAMATKTAGADVLSQPMHISRAIIKAVRAEVGDQGSETSLSAGALSGSRGRKSGNKNSSTNDGGGNGVPRVLTESVVNRMAFGSGIDRLTLTSAVGAPSYVAPEVVRGHRYGPPVDVWACGVILFRMLTGRLPFEGSEPDEVVRKIARGDMQLDGALWDGVSAGARRFVRGLMQMDPRKRLTAESALENVWLTETQ